MDEPLSALLLLPALLVAVWLVGSATASATGWTAAETAATVAAQQTAGELARYHHFAGGVDPSPEVAAEFASRGFTVALTAVAGACTPPVRPARASATEFLRVVVTVPVAAGEGRRHHFSVPSSVGGQPAPEVVDTWPRGVVRVEVSCLASVPLAAERYAAVAACATEPIAGAVGECAVYLDDPPPRLLTVGVGP